MISRKIPKSMIGQQEGGKKEGLVINKLKRYDWSAGKIRNTITDQCEELKEQGVLDWEIPEDGWVGGFRKDSQRK